MKIYRVRCLWRVRTLTGSHQPIVYADTRQEAADKARRMARAAAANPHLEGCAYFKAEVHACNVDERFGRGRRFVVALLNEEGIVDPFHLLDTIEKRAEEVRCVACGNKSRAQQTNPTPEGLLCMECFDQQFTLSAGPTPDSMAPKEASN